MEDEPDDQHYSIGNQLSDFFSCLFNLLSREEASFVLMSDDEHHRLRRHPGSEISVIG